MIKKQISIGEQQGDLRILRAMPMEFNNNPIPDDVKLNEGIVLDCETTGFDSETDEIISLSYIRFLFRDDDYSIVAVKSSDTLYNEPSKPIPDEIKLMTGLNDDMVRGHKIDKAVIDTLVEGVDIVIAHNAKFDRSFIDKISDHPIVWACTQQDIPWDDKYWMPSKSLAVMLSYLRNEYFAHHSSDADTWGAFWLLNETGAMHELINSTFTARFNLIVRDSNFNDKDKIKQIGEEHEQYAKWNSDAKYWYFAELSSADAVAIHEKLLEKVPAKYELVDISLFERHIKR